MQGRDVLKDSGYMKRKNQILAAIDIGAGLGTKIAIAGVKEYETNYLNEHLLSLHDYGHKPEAFTNKIVQIIKEMMRSCNLDNSALCSIGVSIPGFADEHQKIISCNNLPFLDDFDIKSQLIKAFKVNVTINNDADCGGLAQWNTQKSELLYWAFGGGWGGAWVNENGSIQFPNINWDGTDNSIHLTNDPGYVLHFSKKRMHALFNEYGVSWSQFIDRLDLELTQESFLRSAFYTESDRLRAEVFASGKGLWRLYHAQITPDDLNEIPEIKKQQLLDSSAAGPLIFKRFNQGDKIAKKAVSLFGRILGEAAVDVLKTAWSDGASLNIPVYFGGGLAKSFSVFAPMVEAVLKNAGIQSNMYQCNHLKTGQNANLLGAFCVAANNRLRNRYKIT